MRFVTPYQKFELTYPYIGVVGAGANARFCLALRAVTVKNPLLYAPDGYYEIIRIWRAMKILEIVDRVHDTTLSACWSLFHPETRSKQDMQYIKKFAGQFRGEAGLRLVHNSIIASFPSFEDLDMLLSGALSSGMYIDTDELLREMKKWELGLDTPIVSRVIAQNPPKPHIAEAHSKSPIVKTIDSLFGLKF